jgi:hypothetical protein
MGLSDEQQSQVAQIAELETRRYFDTYLNEVFPQQVKAIREHTHLMIEKHDGDRKAHGSAERKINRVLWGVAGIVTLGSLAGAWAAIKALL